MSDSPFSSIYNPFIEGIFDENICFLSGSTVEVELVSIIPDSVIHSFNLKNKGIVLPEGIFVAYSDIKIPVCKEYRENGINHLIKQIGDFLPLGLETLHWIKNERIYQWLVLSFQGVLFQTYKGLYAKHYVDHSFIKLKHTFIKFHLLHLIAQGIVRKVEYENFDPGSLFILRSHSYNGSPGFQFSVGLNTCTLLCRIGEVTLISCLMDQGIQANLYKEYYTQFTDARLHPIQVEELYAKINYKAWLQNQVVEYGIALPDDEFDSVLISAQVPDSKTDEPIFREWDENSYQKVLFQGLAKYGFTEEDLQTPQGVITFIEDEHGQFVQLDSAGDPIGNA